MKFLSYDECAEVTPLFIEEDKECAAGGLVLAKYLHLYCPSKYLFLSVAYSWWL